MYLTIISVFWVCYDHRIRGNVKFITNFRLSLEQVNWNFVDRFLDMQHWFADADNESSDLMLKQFPTRAPFY